MSFQIASGLEIGRTVRTLMMSRAHTATSVLSPVMVVRATRVLVKGQVPTGRLSRADIALTLGRPNYKTRAFIKACQQAGEPFPIRKVHLTFSPTRRKASRKARR